MAPQPVTVRSALFYSDLSQRKAAQGCKSVPIALGLTGIGDMDIWPVRSWVEALSKGCWLWGTIEVPFDPLLLCVTVRGRGAGSQEKLKFCNSVSLVDFCLGDRWACAGPFCSIAEKQI